MLFHSFASLSAIVGLLALATSSLDQAHARPHPLEAALRKRQQSPPPDTGSGPGNNTGGGQASAPLPQGLAPFQDATNLTAWQVLESHPSFTNVSAIARAHSPAVVAALNSTDPGTNLTVFAPYDLAFESIIQQPLFAFANSTDRYDSLITQALAYHVSNATDGSGAVYSDDIPPAPGNLTLPTLAGNLNVTLQRANERPPAPVSISQQTPPPADQPGVTVTVPTVQVPTATVVRPSPTATSPPSSPTTTAPPTPTQTTDQGGEAVGGPLPTDGPGAFANDARIIYANVTLANGVLHVVDRLISPLFIFNNPDLGQVIPTTLPTGAVTRVPPTPTPRQ